MNINDQIYTNHNNSITIFILSVSVDVISFKMYCRLCLVLPVIGATVLILKAPEQFVSC